MSNKPLKEKPNGCIWLLLVLVFAAFGFSIFSLFSNFNFLLTSSIALCGSVLFVNLILGKPATKSLVGYGVVLVIVLLAFRFLSIVLQRFNDDLQNEDKFSTEETVNEFKIVENQDSISIYKSHRSWQDNYGNAYETDLAIRKTDFNFLKNGSSQFNPASGGNFWGQLYAYIYKTNIPSLDLLLVNFEEINTSKKLNQMQFAEMVISCIQDIPYSFVFEDSCKSADTYEPSIKRILQKCPECCIGNILYGVQNPVSFIQNLKGDCDTRTVLIFSILSHFNYDVAILNSDFYLHSVIGVNLPATGDYKIFAGKKYMAWETTSKYYTIGDLPESFNDMQYWNVVITSK